MAKKSPEWLPCVTDITTNTLYAYDLRIKDPSVHFYLISYGDQVNGAFTWYVYFSSWQYDSAKSLDKVHVEIGKVVGEKNITKAQDKANDIIRKYFNNIITSLPAKKLPKRRYKYQYICDGKSDQTLTLGFVLHCDFSDKDMNSGSEMFGTRKEAEKAAAKHQKECAFHGKTYIHTICTNVK